MEETEYQRVNITLKPKHLDIVRTNALNLSEFVRQRLEELGKHYPNKSYKVKQNG